jgi:hypothetical protein
LQPLFRVVFEKANLFLDRYFKNKITLDRSSSPLFLDGKILKGNAALRVSYAGREIENYHVFLNEARLSALAICLYLASIKTNPLPDDSLRILYLDDVFIGLDTCNRIPLLDIIKQEFMDCGFQVFLSSYDRHFYKKIIMNPLSHDDLEAPHYRIEIEGGIRLVESLRGLKCKDVLSHADGSMKPLEFGAGDSTTGVMHTYEFRFKGNLRMAKQGEYAPVFLKAQFDLFEGETARGFTHLHEVFDVIRSERGYPASADYSDFYENIRVTSRKKLKDYMGF